VRVADLGPDPRPRDRERIVSADEVVALLNEFLVGHFIDAANSYSGGLRAVRAGNQVSFSRHFGADGAEWDLALRVGQYRKTVHLYLDYPDGLARVRDRMIRLGGPSSWSQD